MSPIWSNQSGESFRAAFVPQTVHVQARRRRRIKDDFGRPERLKFGNGAPERLK